MGILSQTIRQLCSGGSALLTQAGLHGQLIWVEWAAEKSRLLQMLVVTLLGFACLLCLMLSVVALVLAIFWETPYRILAVTALMLLYAIGTGYAWRRFQALVALGEQSFAATREEFAADMAQLTRPP